MIEAKVMKWGNSLGLRIPKQVAQQIGLTENMPVQMELNGTRLTIELAPASRRTRSQRKPLSYYLSKINSENNHPETATGTPLGKEIV
jgi:antitoxin MazE